MQTLLISELQRSVTSKSGTPPPEISVEAQLRLRSLYEYLDFCRQTLDEIPQDIASTDILRATERLERFCIEADSWGFDALYEIGLGLQMLLLNAGGRVHSHSFRDALRRGLSTLSALLEQCENDFRRRLATADTLDAISQASGE
jgi:hypothetical protein